GDAFASLRLASGVASVLEVHHALDRVPRPRCDGWVDHDLLFHVDEAVEDLRQGDALHVRTEIAGPHELDIGQLGLHVIGHRAFPAHDDALRPILAYPVDHARGRAGVVGFLKYIRRAFRMRDDLQRGIAVAIAAELFRSEALVHLTGALPGDNPHLGLPG